MPVAVGGVVVGRLGCSEDRGEEASDKLVLAGIVCSSEMGDGLVGLVVGSAVDSAVGESDGREGVVFGVVVVGLPGIVAMGVLKPVR